MSNVYEYDGYFVPEPKIKKETPESKAFVENKLKEMKEMAKRHRKEIENKK